MNKQPLTVTINLILLLVNAVIWLFLGIIIAFNLHPAIPDLPGLKLGLAIISFVIVAFLGVVTFLLRRHNPAAYYLALIFFIGTSILTIFDNIGWADVAFLVISVVPILLLFVDRKWYLPPKWKEKEDNQSAAQ